MATRKQIEEEMDNVIVIDDPTTVRIAEKQKKYSGPMVDVFIPALEEEGSGVKVDQYEHVTIANEANEEMHWKIRRGMHVEIPVPVFEQLKLSGRYPNI